MGHSNWPGSDHRPTPGKVSSVSNIASSWRMGSVVSKVLETWKWWAWIGAQVSVFDPVTSQSSQKYTCLNAHNLSRKYSRENVKGSEHCRAKMKMKSLEGEQFLGLTSLNPQSSLKWKAHCTVIPKLRRLASLPKCPAETEVFRTVASSWLWAV